LKHTYANKSHFIVFVEITKHCESIELLTITNKPAPKTIAHE